MKKRLILLFLMLGVVFQLFAAEYKIMSFNINKKKDTAWLKNFSNIVQYVQPDIILLQEVNTNPQNGVVADIVRTISYINPWEYFTTQDYFAYKQYSNNNTGKKYSGVNNATQNNMILYNSNKFTGKDLGLMNSKEFTYYPTQYNNLQCIKLITQDKKELIVINAHISPQGDYGPMKYKANKDSWNVHERDAVTLKNLICDMKNQYTSAFIIAGGDFNYKKDHLTGTWVDGDRLAYDLIVDPERIEPFSTTIGDNDYDHFICTTNAKITEGRKIAIRTVGWDTSIKGKKYSWKEFKDMVSDHWPISFKFEF